MGKSAKITPPPPPSLKLILFEEGKGGDTNTLSPPSLGLLFYNPSSKKRCRRASVAVARRLGSRVKRVCSRSPMPVFSTGAVIA